MKLSVRLTLAFTLAGLVTVSAVALLSWIASANQIRSAIDRGLSERASALESFLQGDIGTELRRNPTPNDAATEDVRADGGGAVLLLDSGDVVGGGVAGIEPLPFLVSTQAANALLAGERWFFSETARGETYRILATPLPDLPVGQDASITLKGAFVFDVVTSEEQAIKDLRLRLLLLGVGAIAAVAAASWFIGRWLSRPLVALTTAVEHVTDPSSSPPERIELDRTDEIGRLADRFNRMLSAIEIGRAQQQRLVADASHELRTPLTALRMRAEFLRSFKTLTPEQQSVVDGAVLDVEQMSALVSDLVDLASDSQTPGEPPQRLPLASIIAESVERSRVATGREIVLDADDSEALVHPDMIRRATQNLIDNATKYSPSDEPILVHVQNGTIEVIDRGPGIPPEDLSSIFDRFFRSSKARTRPGNGIGLAIVQQVADAHGGTTFASNDPEGGARVGFTMSRHGDMTDGAHP